MAQVINNDSNKAPLLLTPELIALYQSAGLRVPGKDKTISSIKNNIPNVKKNLFPFFISLLSSAKPLNVFNKISLLF